MPEPHQTTGHGSALSLLLYPEKVTCDLLGSGNILKLVSPSPPATPHPRVFWLLGFLLHLRLEGSATVYTLPC